MALTMEGKFAGEGLQNIDEDDDMLSAMARELVERNGIGEAAEPSGCLQHRTSKAVSSKLSSSDDDASSSKFRAFCWVLVCPGECY